MAELGRVIVAVGLNRRVLEDRALRKLLKTLPVVGNTGPLVVKMNALLTGITGVIEETVVPESL